jgi:hypothetical protein
MSSLEKKDAEKELAEKVPVQERSTTDMLKELNRVNRAFTDVPDNGEKICYVIPTTIMPPEEYSWRTAINRASSGSWAGEKVRIIHTEQVLSEDEKKDMMIEKINLLRREFKKVYIALPESWQDIELPADVKELKFDGCRHTEEIIVALRAFSRGGDEGVRALTELYEILTGRAYPENVDFDPVDRDKFEHFAQVLVYSLPGMKKLDAYKDNRLLRKLLLSA